MEPVAQDLKNMDSRMTQFLMLAVEKVFIYEILNITEITLKGLTCKSRNKCARRNKG